MSERSFIIGSGYHERGMYSGGAQDARFAPVWFAHLRRSRPHVPVVVITTGSDLPIRTDAAIQQIRTSNLGHVGELISGERNNHLCGWSAGVLALALIAYNCSTDLVYLEQDALAFGPWIEQAYADLGDKQMVFGQAHEDKEPFMPASQSLFIIRHGFLLEFVRRYLSLPSDKEMNPEGKFAEMERICPADFARLSFGVDRTRPIPWEAPVWYAQRFTNEELEEAKRRGLI